MIVYIDFENVQSEGLKGAEKLKGTDRMYIIYTKNACKFDVDFVKLLQKLRVPVSFIESSTGANAADFALVAHMFSSLKRAQTCYIVSKDRGFDSAINMGRKIGFANICRVSSLEDIFAVSAANDCPAMVDEYLEKVEEPLTVFEKDICRRIYPIAKNNENNKSGKNYIELLTTEIGQAYARELYYKTKANYFSYRDEHVS